MDEADEVMIGRSWVRRLPKCEYQFYHRLHPGVEGKLPDHMGLEGWTAYYPVCSASRSHLEELKALKIACRSCCEAEVCPEGWR